MAPWVTHQINSSGCCRLLVPLRGLHSIRLQAGVTVIIDPATGGFDLAAVVFALAKGAW
ncbi:hypothetical protein M433DRAFT_154099 [Acidomyces richmondensis BFW]|nr:MAG: hypothetical protein FE78DRAFT_89977 [Acidomyces sp. 'richmondensis']KYG45835.1 hypothetical protein M433DRAFT_154099 [Acidomyces richmondensis BFW]